MKRPYNCYYELSDEELVNAIRSSQMWDSEMLEALAYRLDVDIDDCEDPDDCVAKILEATGIDLEADPT